jgi:hypothetical protein
VRAALLALAGLAALAAARPADVVCRHPARGPSRPVSLDAVRRSHTDAARVFGDWSERAAAMPRTGFDSALPACVRGDRRTIAFRVPAELVGRTIAFAPEGRFPEADLRVATKAASVADLEADGLAHPDLVERLGVRCWPTRVRGLSEVELELVESP